MTFRGHTHLVSGVAFSPDGKHLASAGWDGTVRVWDASADQEALTIRTLGGFSPHLALSQDGRTLLLANATIPGVWDTTTGRQALTLRDPSGTPYQGPTPFQPRRVAVSPDGKRLAAAGVRLDHQRNKLEVELKVWDGHTGRELFHVPTYTGSVESLLFTSDGQRLVAAGGNWLDPAEIRVWDAATGREVVSRRQDTPRVGSLALSPDGRRLAGAAPEGVKLWGVETGRELRVIGWPGGPVQSAVFSPDGKRLACAGEDRTMKVLDIATGRDVWTLRRSSDRVTCLAFSPDGKRLAGASEVMNFPDSPGEIQLWDLTTGQQACTLQGHKGRVQSLAFSPEGGRLASVDVNGIIKIWDATPRGE